MSEVHYPHLFAPLALGPHTIPNRIVFGPHGTRLHEANLPSERHVAYHGARAKGGAGLIILEIAHVVPRTPADSGPYVSVYKPGVVDGWARIAEEVHGHGAKIFQQLAAPGLRFAATGVRDPAPLLAPSAVPLAPGGELPRPMDQDDIEHLVESFAIAASKVAEAGFDGIEIHAAHGYHLHLWLSPEFNQRDDDYGGRIENRCRVPLAVARAVRDAVGPRMTLGMRISGSDYTAAGMDRPTGIATAVAIDNAGLLDYLSITAGFGSDFGHVIPPMYARHGLHVDLAANITPLVSIPTMARGRITTPDEADKIVANGEADMVGMIRALIADPDLPNKARQGHQKRIRTCVGANDCLGRNQSYVPIGCIYNPDAGNEVHLPRSPRPTARRHVVVIGGGPGGCEAARTAAERGHRVTLMERGDALGGLLLIASRAPGRDELSLIPEYYRRELHRLGVSVELDTEADPDSVATLGADVVVIAAGSRPRQPSVHLPALDVLSARDALAPGVGVGGVVAVYIEAGHIQGLSAADAWAERGRDVTVFTPYESLGIALDPGTRQAVLGRLTAAGVALQPLHRLASGDAAGIELVHVPSGVRVEHRCDTIIHDCGIQPETALAEKLAAQGLDIHLVGDCTSPRGVIGATRDGAAVGSAI